MGLLKRLGVTTLFEKKMVSLDDFAVDLLAENCTAVHIIPLRIFRRGFFENTLVLKGTEKFDNKALAEYREVCFKDPKDHTQTRKSWVELIRMAERRGDELKRLIPDLVIQINLNDRPMTPAERANARAQAHTLNISI